MKDKDGKDVKRSVQHAMYATNFLQGRTNYPPATILELWFSSPDGRVPVHMSQHSDVFIRTRVYFNQTRSTSVVCLCSPDRTNSEARKAVLQVAFMQHLRSGDPKRGSGNTSKEQPGARVIGHV